MGSPMKLLTALIFVQLAGLSEPLFVPEQLTTLLSFLYTNIPPIRKGTDSRVGFGFRLGPNADFQVLFELGPQQNTVPLGSDSSGSSKRDTISSGQPPSTWLQTWHNKQQTPYNEEENEAVQHRNVFPDRDIISHLRQLYTTQPPPQTDQELGINHLRKLYTAKPQTQPEDQQEPKETPSTEKTDQSDA